jgi:hypothetical protein
LGSCHGATQFDKTDWDSVLQQVNTFETLLNKVLLKLLGYSGNYIDRSKIRYFFALLGQANENASYGSGMWFLQEF